MTEEPRIDDVLIEIRRRVGDSMPRVQRREMDVPTDPPVHPTVYTGMRIPLRAQCGLVGCRHRAPVPAGRGKMTVYRPRCGGELRAGVGEQQPAKPPRDGV